MGRIGLGGYDDSINVLLSGKREIKCWREIGNARLEAPNG